ncbi:uncharacterized protein LOC119554131 [Drosophila subpulchrella]|uniref:uncharacterized protein LOC119554131 n=1 Tax=Drosophila subpulchrella TaxID=1486046 RepID=UPI0018A15668|nr:uncharacterized protein LOC119554131 [Drosophila subpulchrella]
MYRTRTKAFLKLSQGLMSPRLLAGSVNKGNSSKESCKDDSKNEEKKKKTDICGRPIHPTSPRCKNKPGGSDKKSEDECKK